MKPRILVDPRADRDLDDHFLYLAQRSPKSASRFFNAAQTTFEKLADMPELGSVGQFSHPKLTGVRVWQVRGFENYLVFYRVVESGIEIIRVLHAARDIEPLLEDDN